MPLLLILAILSLGPSSQAKPTPVDATAQALQQAFQAGDATAMKAHFADKIVFVGDPRFIGEGPGRQVQRDLSRDQLADAYVKLFDAMGRESQPIAAGQHALGRQPREHRLEHTLMRASEAARTQLFAWKTLGQRKRAMVRLDVRQDLV